MTYNYASLANSEVGEARKCLSLADEATLDSQRDWRNALLAEAQVHATLANTFATLAVYAATGATA